MSFSKVHSAQTSLLKAHIIDIEVDLSKGLHAFSIVGLPDKAVEESRDRICAAIKNSGFKSPKSKNEKVTISLAPADIKKEGPAFDLGMAIGYLLAAEEILFDPSNTLFLGELALDGKLRAVTGTLPLIRKAKEVGYHTAFVPKQNAKEAALISGITIFGVEQLSDVVAHINTKQNQTLLLPEIETEYVIPEAQFDIDIKDIRGQETAKRGLEIAAAGGHNVALYGPPGTGKTMLAKAFTSLLPHLSFEDTLEVTGIHSIAGILSEPLIVRPPFRSPHHTASYVAIVGGGANPRPGEATLAHKGVLFLDEFPEFERRVIDSLRQPLEDRMISVSRAKGTAQFPANFILVAATTCLASFSVCLCTLRIICDVVAVTLYCHWQVKSPWQLPSVMLLPMVLLHVLPRVPSERIPSASWFLESLRSIFGHYVVFGRGMPVTCSAIRLFHGSTVDGDDVGATCR